MPGLTTPAGIRAYQQDTALGDGALACEREQVVRRVADQLALLHAQERELRDKLERAAETRFSPLTAVVGVGPLLAATLVAELGAPRPGLGEAPLATLAGVASLEASSAGAVRHRLNRQGNRRLNSLVHRIALAQARVQPPAQALCSSTWYGLWHTFREAEATRSTPSSVLASSKRGGIGGALLRVTRLLPQWAGLRVERLLVLDDSIYVAARRTATTAHCPTCGRRSRRVHSRYKRRIKDEPIVGRHVIVHLRVHRFFCRDRTCPRQTFAEQAPTLASRSARRSAPLDATLQQIGMALGGRPGARLSAALCRLVSRTTLLRLVRTLPLPEASPPRVLGVDD